MLDIYRREIDRVMGLCGTARIVDIDRNLLFPRSNRFG
jgi:isopentenyl diphosphate isomerase/L-lactate dehydrogenase-like FMN-dependent dehydrogenase